MLAHRSVGGLVRFQGGWVGKEDIERDVEGVHHHLVSYYKVKDVMYNTLRTPSKDPALRQLRLRPELTSGQNFREPVDEGDDALKGQWDGQWFTYHNSDWDGYDGRLPMLDNYTLPGINHLWILDLPRHRCSDWDKDLREAISQESQTNGCKLLGM